MESLTQLTLFNYSRLDVDTRAFVETRTTEIKSLVKRSAQDIIEIGQKLTEVKPRLGHGHFGAWLEAEFDWTERTAQQFMRVYERFKNENFSDLNIAPSALYLLSAPSAPEEVFEEAIERAENGERITHSVAKEIVLQHKEPSSNGKPTAAQVAQEDEDVPTEYVNIEEQWGHVETVSAKPMAVHYSSETPEHYTPFVIVEAALNCLGSIDLDPCSNSHETPNVPALYHLTADDNGLEHPWIGKVYMNPPYGREIGAWVNKLCDEYEQGNATEAIALVPARTDTQWFRRLRNYPVCFVEGRLTFIGNDDPAPFPSAVFYLGSEIGAFYRSFCDTGDIWQRIEPEMFGE